MVEAGKGRGEVLKQAKGAKYKGKIEWKKFMHANEPLNTLMQRRKKKKKYKENNNEDKIMRIENSPPPQ